jgi:hypothetical protein
MKKLGDRHGYVFTFTGAALIGLTAYLAGEPTWPREHGARLGAAATTAVSGIASLLGGWRVLSREHTS